MEENSKLVSSKLVQLEPTNHLASLRKEAYSESNYRGMMQATTEIFKEECLQVEGLQRNLRYVALVEHCAYESMYDALHQILHEEGWAGLYKIFPKLGKMTSKLMGKRSKHLASLARQTSLVRTDLELTRRQEFGLTGPVPSLQLSTSLSTRSGRNTYPSARHSPVLGYGTQLENIRLNPSCIGIIHQRGILHAPSCIGRQDQSFVSGSSKSGQYPLFYRTGRRYIVPCDICRIDGVDLDFKEMFFEDCKNVDGHVKNHVERFL